MRKPNGFGGSTPDMLGDLIGSAFAENGSVPYRNKECADWLPCFTDFSIAVVSLISAALHTLATGAYSNSARWREPTQAAKEAV